MAVRGPASGGKRTPRWLGRAIRLRPSRGNTSAGTRVDGRSLVSGRGVGGAFGSEGLLAREHVSDRFGESPGEVYPGNLGAALFVDPCLRLLVAVAVDRGVCRRG